MENNNGNFLTNINNEKDILSYIAQKLTFLDVIAQNMNLIEYNLNKRIDAIEINNKKEMRTFFAEESDKNNRKTKEEILDPFTQEIKKENDDVRNLISYKDKNKKWGSKFVLSELGVSRVKDAKPEYDAIIKIFFAEATRKFKRNCTRWEDVPLSTETMRMLVDICREMIDILGRNKQEGFNINI